MDTHGRVARILVTAVRGSAPRNAGTSMLVWIDGQEGTIGGGALEFEAIRQARKMIENAAAPYLHHQALGPNLGQCCGGSVSLLTEQFTQPDLENISMAIEQDGCFLRPLSDSAGSRPADLQPQGEPAIGSGWVIEQLTVAARHVWIYGAGHVGRAIVRILAEIPDFAITWIDVDIGRFPQSTPPNVTRLAAVSPGDVVHRADPDTDHLVMTYSHAMDLEICARILSCQFRSLRLIGSATKLSRFRSRLSNLEIAAAKIDRIECPIGDRQLGKDPQSIAIGVAASLLGENSP